MPVSPNKIENSAESWNDADWNLFNIIRETVKEDQKAVQETARKCKRLFKQKNSPANPREVLTKLGELLRARQDEQDLAKHINLSKQGNSPKTPDELKESLKKQKEDYEFYIQHFLPALKVEITESKKLDSKKKAAIVQTILDITNRSSSVSSIPNAVEENIEDQMQLKHIEEQNNTQETPLNVAEKKSGDNKILSNSDVTEEVFEKYSKVVEEIEEKQTSKLSSGNDSDSGIDSPRTSKESLKSPVSSRRSSLTLVTSTSSEESVNSDGQANPDQVKEELSQVSLQQVTEARGEESKIPVSRTGMTDDDHTKDPVKSEEKKDKKNTITTVQKLPVNEKKGEDIPLKQPNNRNLHVALVAGCALLAVGCLVAAAIARSGILCVIGAVFAIAAITTWCLTPSSELTSTNLSRPVDDKELTACSHL
ncbi:hypothetical protein [Wolbachia endosymbiont (group A) of Sicus ferrugineus]|uniref:hypothetical protein n=1 Tax=Wolbachia endosymbiont (group A) of Sicus ferrugineus TaxID=2954056 RepID=UPI00222FAEC2|nr:hypothetical protein [Wolbachia endosymbiont (group A) of Sicus ferrugineus]